MGFIIYFKQIRVIKSRQGFFKTKPMKAFIYPALFIIPFKASIRADYRSSYSMPYNNVYTIILICQVPYQTYFFQISVNIAPIGFYPI
jgi:hypothetical protein